jgi:integrase
MKRTLPPFVYLRKGRYAYFERGGICQRMPDPGTPEFHRAYAKLIGGAKKEHVGPRTFAALVKSYRNSEYFTRLKPRTQEDYNKVCDYIVKVWGSLPVDKAKTKDVIRAQRESDKGARFGNYIVSVLSVLFTHATRIGWIAINPARGVEMVKTEGREREPWPDHLIAAFRAKAEGNALLAFELCLGTGQRIGDVMKMKWSDIEGGGVLVKQNKTEARLWIPITPRLAALLAKTPRNGFNIIQKPNGRPATQHAVSEAILKVRKAIGAEAYDIHSLRYTVAAQMAAAGHDDDTIAAITGHSSKRMVAKYGGKARQITRAKKAQEGRE